MNQSFEHPISIAPMMKCTDRHFRFFMRLITKRTLLYTEMVTTGAILKGPRERLLSFSDVEHPISLQVGGSDLKELAQVAKIAEDYGYDEINLNVGCPSDRVQNNLIGACLMKDPDLVARAFEAMQSACSIPVTIKHRIGVDHIDSYDDMIRFVDTVASAGCTRFTVHARKAWLQGLSPAENRHIPPLRHPEVHRLKEERPHLIIETNGGIQTLDDAEEHLQHVDAAMIGRAAYKNPYLFADVDRRFYGDQNPGLSRHDVIRALFDYIEYWTTEGGARLSHLTRHFLQIFAGQPGANRFRRYLSENAHLPDAGLHTLREALALVPEKASAAQAL